MDSTTRKPEEQNVPVAGLTGVDLLRYFSLQASEVVDERIRQREERRAKRTAAILTLVGLVGVSGSIALINYTINSTVTSEIAKKLADVEHNTRSENDRLRRDIEALLERQSEVIELRLGGASETTSKILDQQSLTLKHQDERVQGLGTELGIRMRAEAEKAIGSQVGSLQSNLSTELDYQRLNTFALGLDLRKSFAPSERDAVLDLLKRLKGTTIVGRSDFQEVLRKIVDSFHSADQGEQIDEIDDLLGDVMLNSRAIVEILTNHYGQRVIGSRHSVAEITPVVSRLKRYLARSRAYDSPEIEIFWELLMEVKRAAPDDVRENQEGMRALQYLDDSDRSFFFVKLVEYSVPPIWVEHPTYASTEIARICQLFRRAHAEKLRTIFAQIPNGEEKLAARLADVLKRPHIDEAAIKELSQVLSELTKETPPAIEG